MTTIKTRILILSDTHGKPLEHPPPDAVDVAIHSGDLTQGSQLFEFRTAIALLEPLNAPLKLVIAGNHDFTLDDAAFARIVSEANPPLEPDLVAAQFGKTGEARDLLDEAGEKGIVLLDEGNHEFTLQNGARLRVYASPFTPGEGGWGFQYAASSQHDVDIADNTDIVITHGPPHGIFDRTVAETRAGCPSSSRPSHERGLPSTVSDIYTRHGVPRSRGGSSLLLKGRLTNQTTAMLSTTASLCLFRTWRVCSLRGTIALRLWRAKRGGCMSLRGCRMCLWISLLRRVGRLAL